MWDLAQHSGALVQLPSHLLENTQHIQIRLGVLVQLPPRFTGARLRPTEKSTVQCGDAPEKTRDVRSFVANMGAPYGNLMSAELRMGGALR